MKHFRHIFQFTAIIALLVISSHPVHAQRAPVWVIKGIILDSATNAQISKPTITFTATGSGAGKTITLTAHRDGRFRQRLSRRYFWDMTVSAPGYESFTWKAVNSKNEYKGGVWLVVKLKKLS